MMKKDPSGEMADKTDAREKIPTPQRKIFLRPTISAILPTGMRNTAAVSMKTVETQPRRTALMENSFPIAFRATFTAEETNGVRNELNAATSKATDFTGELWSG